jgi:carbamoyltransferase
MTNDAFADLFGGPARVPETRITRREMDLAASVQVVLEDIVLAVARHLRTLTGSPNLVMAGGVALNCVANGRLHRARVFDRLWIQPAAGDAGGALGAALLAAHEHFGATRPSRADGRDSQHGSLLGPSFSPAQIRAFLDRHGYPYQQVTDPSERAAAIAGALADGKVVGHFAGRMEFGPRALGARSILADPRRPDTQATMNLKIKFRESFRPFAPSVLAERSGDYFDLDVESPYMLLVAPVRGDRRRPVPPADSGDDDMLRVVNQVRSDIPAVTHVDYSARIQTVSREDHPIFYDVIRALRRPDGLRRSRQHVVQRARRADSLHAAGCVSLFHAHRHGRARSRGLSALEARTAADGGRRRVAPRVVLD